MKSSLKPLVLLIATTFSGGSLAQGVASDQQLQSVAIDGNRLPLAPNLPMTTASMTAQELREQQNVFNPEDVLRNLPNTTIRKRYSGDRNALIGGRSFGTTQAPRGLVFMDGYLISNFLGRFDAPRWNMIAPEEIERVDVLYGPFSAIYPGNSIGTTVVMTTKKPKTFEGSARFAVQSESFDAYGQSETFTNTQASVLLGDKLASGWSYRLMLNRQDSTGHPMQYYTVNANAAGIFVPPTGSKPTTPVTGVQYDAAPTGQTRAVFGANAGAIDHTVQTTAKAVAGYDITSAISAEAMLAWWTNDTVTRNNSFLRDANGNRIWSGRVSNNGNVFDIPANSFAPYNRAETHLQAGLTVKSHYQTGWNMSVVASQYRILKDLQRNANFADPIAANGGAGNAVLRDGTGFRTFEVQSAYTPVAGDFGDGKHALTFGIHANDYHLQQSTQTLNNDWRTGAGAENQFVGGDTRLFALYAQDAWRFASDWRATFGLRLESWKAFNGVQRFIPGATQNYTERSISAASPKVSLAWEATDDMTLRLSAGRGTRFATVAELFQGSQSGSAIVVNDPNLKPEQSDAVELMLEKRYRNASLRVSLFQDDIRNTIWSQTNTAVFPNITNVQNVGRVRTRGIELAAEMDNLFINGLNLDGNLAFNDSKIIENDNFIASVGKTWVRIPRVRSAVTLSYATSNKWSVAGTYRYSGRQYNEMTNIDINPDTYGGLSRVKQLDLRVLFKPAKGLELAAGIDNVFDYRAYQSHPLPARNLFAEARYAF
ncbi:TonB-dependent receptor [Undibacterium sp. RTI2.1]|uniref:TonB-dependent receptor n=1 Tax=unclassified Undibacterium TaxID=2630295 RepID=UPI002AB43793|nr:MULTISPECIES: TonB-dependent receptor [unclassified Undibacterium]MDY7536741.1 TonB-dependent receptor [Undibacterium sp. 5I1]MEB0032248.1 TonB-dependent receptor [Undibacterium sp. RTI2.1]MEB0115780.1 TonB-dependent receptor [Undibacterium sp. RTI2.2]MEB0231895.1 TonB-dependent receptor [Undibacterium sp. 10I3]MEB0256623.1 TonB-dependent receptor [Undibacterium sp. 5I1]